MNKIIFALFIFVLSISKATAADIINKIELDGNIRVQDAVVLSYIPYSEGMEYSSDVEKRIVKAIYSTGLFEDVVVNWDEKKGIIKISMKENPQVNLVVFEGNREFADSVLKKQLKLKPRTIYTNSKVSQDIRTLEKTYQLKGYYLAKVTPEYIQRDQNRIDLIYKIDEGEKTLIDKINFIGNKRFSDPELRRVITSRENRWWKFLTSSDTYDEQRLFFDAEKIRRFYLERGFADFVIQDPVVELIPSKKSFVVTFTMEEGAKYRFGNVDLEYDESDIEIEKQELRSLIDIEKNQTYSSADIEKNIDKLVDKLSDLGYAFTDITPLMSKNEDTRQINLVFKLDPGNKVYINKINIEGNTRTRDNVIRRQLRLSEGDSLQANKLKRSRDRLTYLDYFSKVDISPRQTSEPDKIDLDIEVQEQSTGEFNIGAGVSSYEGLLASMDIRENNFLGKGQKLNFGFSFSSKRQDYNIGLVEPWFMDRELLAGVNLYSQETSYDDESSYDEKVVGSSLKFGFPIDEYRKNTIGFKYENQEVTDVDDDASVLIKDLEGDRSKVAISNTFSIDTRDNFLVPTKGYNASWTFEYAGFGGDISYIKNILKGSYNIPIEDDYVLTFAARAGYLLDISDKTPITENFRLGGNTLRGFAPSGIGPRDTTTDDALGGQFLIGHNVEFRYPLPGMRESGVNGIAFWDGGMVTSVDDPYNVSVDTKKYRQSVGAGIFWRSPLGPLRFEFGIPIVSADRDDKEIFSFSFGTNF